MSGVYRRRWRRPPRRNTVPISTEVAHFYAEQNTQSSRDATSWAEPTNTCRIAGTLLKPNTKYLILARAMLNADSDAVVVGCRIATADDTNIASKSATEVEMVWNQIISNKWAWDYTFAHSFTTDASPADVQFEHHGGGGTDTCGIGNMSLLLIDLDDYEAKGGTYHEDINAATGSEIQDDAVGWTTLASIAGSDLGTTEQWAVFGYAKIGIGSVTEFYRTELYGADDASTASTLGVRQEEGEDTTEERGTGFFGRHKAVTSNVDLIIRAQEQSATANMTDQGSYLIALKGSAFQDFEHDYQSAQELLSVTEETIASVGPYTPTVNGKHLIIGQTNESFQDGNIILLHLEDGTTETRTDDSAYRHEQQWGQGREISFTMQLLDQREQKTWNLRAKSTGGTPGYEHRWLIVLNLNMVPSAGPTVVTPATVAAVADVPDPTAAGKAIVTPAAVAAVAGTPTPTIAAAATVQPATVGAVFDVPDPTPLGKAITTPTAVAAVADAPAPTPRGAAIVTPAAVDTVTDTPTPTPTISPTVNPAAVAAVADVPDPAAVGKAIASPAAVAGVFDAPDPAVLAASLVTPAVVAGVFDAPDPTAVGKATASPAAVAGIFDTPTPGIAAAAVVTPAAVAAIFDAPDPTVVINIVVNPATVAAIFGTPTPGVTAAAAVVPPVVAAAGSVPDPGISAAVNVSPAVAAILSAVPTPTPRGQGAASPAAVAGIVDVPVPTILVSGSTVFPATVAAVADVPTPTIAISPTVTPSTVAAVVAVPNPSPSGAAAAAPGTVAGIFTTPTPTVTVPAAVSPAVVAAVAAVLTPAAAGAAVVTPAVVAVLFAVPTPPFVGAIFAGVTEAESGVIVVTEAAATLLITEAASSIVTRTSGA